MGVDLKFLKNTTTQAKVASGAALTLGSLFLLYKNYPGKTSQNSSLATTASVSSKVFKQAHQSFDKEGERSFCSTQLQLQVEKMRLIEEKLEGLCALEKINGLDSRWGFQEGEFQALQKDMLVAKQLLYADRIKTLKIEVRKLKKGLQNSVDIPSFQQSIQWIESCANTLKGQGALFEGDTLFEEIEQLKMAAYTSERSLDKQSKRHIKTFQFLDGEKISFPQVSEKLLVNIEDLVEIPSDGSCLYHALYTYGISRNLFSQKEISSSRELKGALIEFLKKKWKHILKPMNEEKRRKSTLYTSLLHVYVNVREDKLKSMREDLDTQRFLLENQGGVSLKNKVASLEKKLFEWERKYPPFDPQASTDIYIDKCFKFLSLDNTWGGDEMVHAFINWMYEKKKSYVPVVWLSSEEASLKPEKEMEKLFTVSYIFKEVDPVLNPFQEKVKGFVPAYLWHKNHNHFNLYLTASH